MKSVGKLLMGGMATVAILAAAAPPSDWKFTQDIEVPGAGLISLSLPLETIAAARSGLEDLRLVDDADHEVPYVLERARPMSQETRPAKAFQVMLNNDTTVITLTTGVSQSLEAVTLETPAANFIKAVQVEGSRDQTHWEILAVGRPIFREPSGASQLRVNFSATPWPYLRLTVDDHRAAPIAFSGASVQVAPSDSGRTEPVPVLITGRMDTPSQTRLTLNLSHAHLTLAALHLETDAPLFTRRVTVVVRQVADHVVTEHTVAQGTGYRIAVEGQPLSANLDIPVEFQVPHRELFLVIDNGEAPPLPVAAIRAERRPVYVLFYAPQGGTYHLLSGNSRCTAPRYDLAALGVNLKAPPPSVVPVTALRGNLAYRPAEVLPELADPGTVLETRNWKYRKSVQLTRAGVQGMDLDLETLSHADANFRDLRLMRAEKQRPYILERTSLTKQIIPQVELLKDPKRPSVSRWQLKLPQRALPLLALQCTTLTPLFKRDFALYETVADERGEKYQRPLGQGQWIRTPSAPSALLTLSLSSPPTTDVLILETDNGDNGPLALDGFSLAYPITRLLFKSPQETPTYLYYGNAEVDAPHYDLDLVAGELLAAEKISATLGAEEPLKKPAAIDFSPMSRSSRVVFWSVLGTVVAVLLVVISRLLPKPPS